VLSAALWVSAMAAVGLSFALRGHTQENPNQQLVEYVAANYAVQEVTVCWDNQTHSYFEINPTGITPVGYWSFYELETALRQGRTVLLTERCRRSEELGAIASITEVARFEGQTPAWSKAPRITLYEAVLR
jgi:hypothetical protein